MKMIYTFLMAKAKPIALKGEHEDNNGSNEMDNGNVRGTGSPSPSKRRTTSGGSPEAFAVTAVINSNYLDSFHSAELPDSFLEDHDHFRGDLGT
jgi:hypothetical protein